MSFAGKAAGKHGKDSGGTWKENMRALWSNYEAGADALAYGLWLAQLQHVAATTYQEPPVPNESFKSHLDRCYNKSSHNRYEEFVEGLAAQYYTGALAQSLAEASFNKDMVEKLKKKVDELEKKSLGLALAWSASATSPNKWVPTSSPSKWFPTSPSKCFPTGKCDLATKEKAMEKEQEQREAAEKEAEEKRKAAEKEVEEKKKAADKEAEEKKKLVALQALADKQAKDKKEAAEKEAEEKKKEAEKEAEEKKAALARLHAWKATGSGRGKEKGSREGSWGKEEGSREAEAAEEKKKAAEKEAEEKKKAADKEAKEKKEAAEKEAKEKKEAAEKVAAGEAVKLWSWKSSRRPAWNV